MTANISLNIAGYPFTSFTPPDLIAYHLLNVGHVYDLGYIVFVPCLYPILTIKPECRRALCITIYLFEMRTIPYPLQGTVIRIPTERNFLNGFSVGYLIKKKSSYEIFCGIDTYQFRYRVGRRLLHVQYIHHP